KSSRVRLPLLSRSSNRHTVEFDCGHTYADWNALPRLAAGANALIQCEVIADHRHILQRFRPVADEGCAFDGAGNLPVLDEVGLGGREDELAVSDVDLTTAEVDGVEATFDGLDDVLGHVVAVEHVGVGHAGHGDVMVALPASAAG